MFSIITCLTCLLKGALQYQTDFDVDRRSTSSCRPQRSLVRYAGQALHHTKFTVTTNLLLDTSWCRPHLDPNFWGLQYKQATRWRPHAYFWCLTSRRVAKLLDDPVLQYLEFHIIIKPLDHAIFFVLQLYLHFILPSPSTRRRDSPTWHSKRISKLL